MLTFSSVLGIVTLIGIWCEKMHLFLKIILTIVIVVLWFASLLWHCVRKSEREETIKKIDGTLRGVAD